MAIELPKPENQDKAEIAKLRTALKDARYIHAKYRKTLPEDAWTTIGLILNDPKLKTKGGSKQT